MAQEYLSEIGQAFVPKKFRPNLRNYLLTAGIDEVPFKFFGGLFFSAIFITIITYFIFIHQKIATKLSTFIVGAIAFGYILIVALILCAITILFFYFYLNIKIYNRTKKLEDKLVDYLTLVSTNLKGGLSFEKSLWVSIKPDFGILAKEIGLVSKKVLTGNDLTEALIEFSMKYDSPNLKRSMNLIIGEIESGGKVVEVIDKVIINLRKTKMLKDEMAASTITYMIFIGAIVMVISPALFALSGQLLYIIIGFVEKIGGSIASSGIISLNLSNISIDPKQFQWFCRGALITIGTSSAFIISIIEKGDIKGGLRYVPLFVVVSLVIYEILNFVLKYAFSSFVA
jgi:Flp pilus assembly protein TadB